MFEQVCSNNACDKFNLKILNIHVSYYGIAYYFLILLSTFYLIKKYSKLLAILLLLISIIGFCFSLYFLCYQIFIIHGICYYCLASFIFTFIILILLILIKKI
jgi:uncharacterized membrane protein